jgi:hypothetical protein
MSFNEIYKQSIEDNNILLQTNQANALQDLSNKRSKVIIRIIPDIKTPDKIKYFYSNLQSFTTRSSQKPNYNNEKTSNTIKVDTPQLSGMYITNVQKVVKTGGPKTFESVIEKNILNMPPVIEREFEPDVIRVFDKIGKNNDLNFIQIKSNYKKIDTPFEPVFSNKTILKRL